MNTSPDAPRPAPAADTREEPPPLGSWGRMYALVLGCLGAWIVIFYLFTEAFR